MGNVPFLGLSAEKFKVHRMLNASYKPCMFFVVDNSSSVYQQTVSDIPTMHYKRIRKYIVHQGSDNIAGTLGPGQK